MVDYESDFERDLNERYVGNLETEVSGSTGSIPYMNFNETVLEISPHRTGIPNVIQEVVDTFDQTGEFKEVVALVPGMMFPSGDEFAAFIYSYAYKKGFELFIRSNDVIKEYKKKWAPKWGKSHVYEYHMYKHMRMMCRKGVEDKHEGSNVTYYNFYVDARIKHQQTMMEITMCYLEHNHPIVLKNRSFMASYRIISDYFKRRVMKNEAAGISLVNNYNSLVLEARGHGNLPFNSSDLRNCVNLERPRIRIGYNV